MNRTLSGKEITHRYGGEWVYIGDPVWDKRNRLLRGRILFHHRDSDEVWRKALAAPNRPRRVAMIRIGKPPAGLVYALNL